MFQPSFNLRIASLAAIGLLVVSSAAIAQESKVANVKKETIKELFVVSDPAENGTNGWWSSSVTQPMRQGEVQQLTLDEVLARTLQYSQQVKVFSETPIIRRTAVIEADAAFDWTRFFDTRWDDLSDPVGSSLTVGGTGTRYVNQQWSGRGGVRRRNRAGGEFEISQGFGWQETNSNFFIPNPQGTARLILNYTQPLLRGRGRAYNQSLLVLASIDQNVAEDEFSRQLQSHLLEVTRAYWSLYLERGVLLQKMNSFQRANEIYEILTARATVDAQQSQIASAKATAVTRNAELIRARTAVMNAESRLKALVNDPTFGAFNEVELIPLDAPTNNLFSVNMEQSMALAVQNRPEILQGLKQVKAGCLRTSMTKHELLPVLNLITQAYVAGLRPDGDTFDAFSQQFSEGQPSYAIGVEYEIPFGNRAAKARHTRRQLELRQLRQQYQTVLETVNLEVAVAVREIETAGQELHAKLEAMNARAAQLDALTLRWEALPGEDVTASLALENLLDAQDRLAQAEYDFLQSQLTYNLALMNIKRATGILLQSENIQMGETCMDGLKTTVLTKSHSSIESFVQPIPAAEEEVSELKFEVVPKAEGVAPVEIQYPHSPRVPEPLYYGNSGN